MVPEGLNDRDGGEGRTLRDAPDVAYEGEFRETQSRAARETCIGNPRGFDEHMVSA